MAWTVREGFFKSAIVSLAQGLDGYLWVGTELGLLRFDGVRAVPLQAPNGQAFLSSYIWVLKVTRDGTLWIGTANGLGSWKNGSLTIHPEFAGRRIGAILEDREGTLSVATLAHPHGALCAIRGAEVKCNEEPDFGTGILSMYEHKGIVWAGAASGLWRLKPGPRQKYAMQAPLTEFRAFAAGDNDSVWACLPDGIWQLPPGDNQNIDVPHLPFAREVNPTRMLRDRDGGLWIGSSGQGLSRLYRNQMTAFQAAQGLSGDRVFAILEDREGSIWIATSEGLDRFREFTVSTITPREGLSSGVMSSVLATRDGTVWMGSTDGLNRWEDGEITVYRKQPANPVRRRSQAPARELVEAGLPGRSILSILQDHDGRLWVSGGTGLAYELGNRFVPAPYGAGRTIYTMEVDAANDLWACDQFSGLLHFSGGHLKEQFPFAKLGHKDVASRLVWDKERGGLWLGFLEGGLVFFKDGEVQTSLAPGNGLSGGVVTSMLADRDGTLWIATAGGLSRFQDGRFTSLTSRDGLPCDAIHWMLVDDDRALWLHMQCGLVRITRAELDAWAANTRRPITKQKIQMTVFESSDGVRSQSQPIGYTPGGTKTSDGKLWFTTYGGVLVVDPRHIHTNPVSPPVHVEQITADGRQSSISSLMRLPASVRDVSIDYTALSLVAPEKVRFRYMLEGQDRDWTEVVNQRSVHYSNLGPRKYRFRVMACNNSGLWNEAGASLDFFVAPAYYQTALFRAACVVSFLALLAGLYQLRLRQIARQFNLRAEERIAERTRIARDLHDTMLQSFQGVLLKFSALTYVLQDRPEIQTKLEGIVEQGGQRSTKAGRRCSSFGPRPSSQTTWRARSGASMRNSSLARRVRARNWL